MSTSDRTADLLAGSFTGVQNRQTEIYVRMWLRDDVRCNDLADSLARGGACIHRTPDSGYVATHDRGHEPGVDLFPTDETNVRGFYHGVSGFDHRYEAAAFHHSECFRHQLPPSTANSSKASHKKAQKAQN